MFRRYSTVKVCSLSASLFSSSTTTTTTATPIVTFTARFTSSSFSTKTPPTATTATMNLFNNNNTNNIIIISRSAFKKNSSSSSIQITAVAHTSLRFMYLPPKPKAKTQREDLIVTYRSNAIMAFLVLVSFIAFTFLMLFTFVANRFRSDETNARKGKRVVVIGGASAGSMAAAALTTLDSDVHVTVIDKKRVQTFTAQVPLAAAGHRSYDLRAKGPSSLFASTCWTVTREASLVIAEVIEINPEKKFVVDDQGVKHEYDALVIAAGCEQDHSAVGGYFSIDQDRVAVSPGGIRDFLTHTATGNVLIVRAPSKSEFHRGAENTWVSMVNTCWKHLHFFGRTGHDYLSKVYAVTCDDSINDVLPDVHKQQIESFWEERGINVRTQWKLSNVDRAAHCATFENTVSGETTTMPFNLLIVDLPVEPPKFLQSVPGLCNEHGFVAVDPTTLQHTKYPDIFALGDCAALPIAKSYGAISVQAPVLGHNVLQHLHDRTLNAEYDLFSSFHINMSTWRCMWPELRGNKGVRFEPRCGYWDDSDWRYWKGFLQGFYLQEFLYDCTFWFLMLRAHWCAKTWFRWPVFEEGAKTKEEGDEEEGDEKSKNNIENAEGRSVL